MTGFLASVTSVEEAVTVLDLADIIDLKNPSRGALGDLPFDVVESIVRHVDGLKPVSATVGDLPMEPQLIADAVVAMSRTGVDIVKVGFFGGSGLSECIDALAQITAHCKLVAVLFADQQPDYSVLDLLAQAGFYGAMLDTAEKSAGGLRQHLDEEGIQCFVKRAKSYRLFTGLAGSLRLQDIPSLVKIQPDYLGFRGVLCQHESRRSAVEKERVQAVAGLLRECNSKRMFRGLQLQS